MGVVGTHCPREISMFVCSTHAQPGDSRAGRTCGCLGKRRGFLRGSRERHSRLGEWEKQDIAGGSMGWVRKSLNLCQDTEHGKQGRFWSRAYGVREL